MSNLANFVPVQVTIIKDDGSNYDQIRQFIIDNISVLKGKGITHFVIEHPGGRNPDLEKKLSLAIRNKGMTLQAIEGRSLVGAVEGCLLRWGAHAGEVAPSHKVAVLTSSTEILANKLKSYKYSTQMF